MAEGRKRGRGEKVGQQETRLVPLLFPDLEKKRDTIRSFYVCRLVIWYRYRHIKRF